MEIPTSFTLVSVLFDKAFKYDGVKFWGYAGTNAELLCVELCNFVLCHILVNYLSSCQCVST
jgi:hypothetical protein